MSRPEIVCALTLTIDEDMAVDVRHVFPAGLPWKLPVRDAVELPHDGIAVKFLTVLLLYRLQKVHRVGELVELRGVNGFLHKIRLDVLPHVERQCDDALHLPFVGHIF
ncbi:hypothetical protein D9M72_522020 [compost metagenome]